MPYIKTAPIKRVMLAAVALVGVLSTTICAPAFATENIGNVSAYRMLHGTKCDWHNLTNQPSARIVSAAAIGQADPIYLKWDLGGRKLGKFQFAVRYHKQAHKHVAPTVVIEYKNASGQTKFKKINSDKLDSCDAKGCGNGREIDFKKHLGGDFDILSLGIGGREEHDLPFNSMLDCDVTMLSTNATMPEKVYANPVTKTASDIKTDKMLEMFYRTYWDGE